jgi:hypothetical protein
MKLKRGPALYMLYNAPFVGFGGTVMPQGRRLPADRSKPLCIMHHGWHLRDPGGYVVCHNFGDGHVH